MDSGCIERFDYLFYGNGSLMEQIGIAARAPFILVPLNHGGLSMESGVWFFIEIC